MNDTECYDDLEMDWVGDWIGCRARLTPHRIGVYDTGSEKRLTYQTLNERANRVGTYLLDHLGLKKGDAVCFLSRNRIEPIDLYFAAGKTGIVLSPLSFRLVKPELDDLLNRIAPKAFFYEAHFSELAKSLDMPASVIKTVCFGTDDATYDREVLTTLPRDVNRPLAMKDVFLYVHTGGTTAVPKICVITHRQMVWNSVELIVTGGKESGFGEKELVTFPFFHIGGWNTVTPVFHMGGEVVLMREFHPDLALELIDREGITHFGGVEAMFRFMLGSERFERTTFKSVKYINSAGAPCDPSVMKPFWDKGIALTQSYGLTEGGPSNFVFVPGDLGMDAMRAHADSIGFPMFHCDAKMIDPETKQPVQPGQVGELCLRSPHNFAGYLNDPKRTQKVVDEAGWVHSGDLARSDPNGFVTIVGRADNMFISGGENVSPEEIEQAILRHPGVDQVGVVAVSDAQWGQVGLALIIPKSGISLNEPELRAFCKTQLAGFKVPKYFRFVESLPLTGAGKINRQALSAMRANHDG